MRRHAAFIYGFQPRSQYFRLLLVDDISISGARKRLLREGGGGLCVPHTARDFAQAVSRLLVTNRCVAP